MKAIVYNGMRSVDVENVEDPKIEKSDDISCLLYIDYKQGNDFIKDLENIKRIQQENMNK